MKTDLAAAAPRSWLTSRRRDWLRTLTAPVIWAGAIPITLLDLFGTAYQAVCFPIYGIPKVRRRDYLAFDRHHLDYLGSWDKFNCEYCAYANGILGYFREIAGRTEQYWCPIRHARPPLAPHSRYHRFLPYGDGEQFIDRFPEVRHAFADLAADPPGTRPAPAVFPHDARHSDSV